MSNYATRSSQQPLNGPLSNDLMAAFSPKRKPPVKLVISSKDRPKSDNTKAFRQSFCGENSIATINVIEAEKTTPFKAHKSFLISHSEYFAAAFRGNYEEAKTSVINLEDVSATTIDIFIGWIYRQTILTPQGEVPEFFELVDLWLFSDRALVPRLQNEVFPFRQYIVAIVSRSQLLGSKDLEDPKAYPREMLIDLINCVARIDESVAVPRSRRAMTPAPSQIIDLDTPPQTPIKSIEPETSHKPGITAADGKRMEQKKLDREEMATHTPMPAPYNGMAQLAGAANTSTTPTGFLGVTN
ncbi:putative Kelch repeat and BTB domain-containing protein 4 [Glarea lozoyensis 74030]|uniref:Putative Kelch repeat and BTB domain-containing protein 4 n=1 Tax=Glarea lozoyensis (strain ATCC 74030 / MF5533) TaxID=1104152 RepID=H0EV40_GLAL7|nr:putative Kelch repeat and BTB domain-containing protein 4 [Glarea lozoyensis 74030]